LGRTWAAAVCWATLRRAQGGSPCSDLFSEEALSDAVQGSARRVILWRFARFASFGKLLIDLRAPLPASTLGLSREAS
jgi:hypothetical protein